MEHAVVTRGRRCETKVHTYVRRYVWTQKLGRNFGRYTATSVGVTRYAGIDRAAGRYVGTKVRSVGR